MESLLELLGMLFFMFLVLSAAVEVILDVFRGILERIGLTWIKGKVSLDDALALAAEFAPDNSDLNTKLQAVKSATAQLKERASDRLKALEELRQQLTAAGTNMNVLAGELHAIASSVRLELEQSERQRIFILRSLAAVIGCLLTWQSNFYVFQILSKSPKAPDWMSTLTGLQSQWINILVGGLAAAAGSAYWHDKLDKVRNLKSATQEVKKFMK